MTENMKKFLEAVSKNKELCKKLGTMGEDELLALAKELGLQLTAADLEKPVQELDEDELDIVAGGSDTTCVCVVGGGGTKDSNDKTCACVVAGFGYDKSGDVERCACGFGGSGYDT